MYSALETGGGVGDSLDGQKSTAAAKKCLALALWYRFLVYFSDI